MPKLQQKEQEAWKIINSTIDCPYKKCDGNGIVIEQNIDTFEIRTHFCRCRAEKIQANRLLFANIPEEFKGLTVNSFDCNLYATKNSRDIALAAKTIAKNYVAEFQKYKEKGKGLYFYSQTKGSGKTRLAISIGNALIKVHKQSVKFLTTLDLLNEIKNTYNANSKYSESQLIESINSVAVLILDDFGVERPTDWVSEILFNILDNRMKSLKVTIFTSNDIAENLKHNDRIKSRITKMAAPIIMPEESIREKIAKIENTDLLKELLS